MIFKDKIRKIILLIVLYVVLISIVTYPLIYLLISRDNSTVIGESYFEDLWGGVWYYWWTGYSLENGLNFFYTDYLSYPHGQNLWIAPGNFLIFFLFYPVIKVCGLINGYNTIAFIILLINCLTGFLLVYELIRDRYLSFWGGFLIGINCFTLNELRSGRLEQLSIFWMIFYIWALIRLKNTMQKKYIFISAICFLLTVLNSWHYGIILSWGFFFWWLAALLEKDWKNLKDSIVSFGLGMLLISPVLICFIHNLNLEYNNFFANISSKSDILPFFPIMKDMSVKKQDEISLIILTLFFLCIIISRTIRKKYSYWILLGISSLIFSLGPVLQWNNKVTTIYLPFYYFIKYIPFMGRFFWPRRFLVLFYLSGVIIISGVLKLSLAERNKYIKLLILGLLTGALIFELAAYRYIFPVMFSKVQIPSIYYELAKLPQGGVLDLPYFEDRIYLYAQTIHGKKMINNTIVNPRLLSVKTRKLIERFDLSGMGWFIKAKEDVNFLKELGIKYIILREFNLCKSLYKPDKLLEEGKKEKIKERFDFLLGQPYMHDEGGGVSLYMLDDGKG